MKRMMLVFAALLALALWPAGNAAAHNEASPYVQVKGGGSGSSGGSGHGRGSDDGIGHSRHGSSRILGEDRGRRHDDSFDHREGHRRELRSDTIDDRGRRVRIYQTR
jgi:hypothetical protein